MTMTAQQAIRQSIRQNEIVHLEYDEDIATELQFACDDSVVGNEVREFWGTTEDGDEWRVHLA